VQGPVDVLDTPHAGPSTIRGGGIRAAAYVAGVLLAVISTSLLIRHLGIVDYGRYITVIALITIVQGFSDAGLVMVGVREYSTRVGAARDELMRDLLGLRMAVAVAGTILAAAFAAIAGYGGTLVLGTVLAGVGLLLTVTQDTVAIPLTVRLRLGSVAAYEFLRQILSVIGIAALALAGAQLLAFFALPIPVGIIVILVTLRLMLRTMPPRPAFHPARWLALLRPILPLTLAGLAGTLYFRITMILMSLLATAIETGYYATAFRVLEVAIGIPAILVSSTLPLLSRAARDDAARLRYALTRMSETALIVGSLFGLCMVLGAGFAMNVLGGEAAKPSVPVLQIQSIAVLGNFVAAGWQYGLVALHRHRALLVNSLIALATSAVVTSALIPSMQAKGAAIGVSVGEVLLAAIAFVQVRRAGIEIAFPRTTAWKVLVAVALGAAILAVPGISSFVQLLIGGSVYVLVLVVMRAMPPELWEAVEGRLRGYRASRA
jgi:O-antigen/teichoic acid export membrane protein